MMYKTVSLIQRFQAKSDETPSLSDMVSQNDISALPALASFIKIHINIDKDISESKKIYNDFLMFLASFLIENAHSFLFNLFTMNEENTWQHNKELKNAVMPKVEQYISSKVEFPYFYKLVLPSGETKMIEINKLQNLKDRDYEYFDSFLNALNKSDDKRPFKRQKI